MGQKITMPIYMDLHIIPGVQAKEVADAHLMDTMIQEEHDCKCMTYWIDELRGHVFCLIEAPEKEMVVEMHNRSHGLVPHKIIEVQTSLVESFLGRVNDPEEAELTDKGLKLINDPSFRTILFLLPEDVYLLHHQYGREKAMALVSIQKEIIREQLSKWNGKETEYESRGTIASFVSVSQAIQCAIAIDEQLRKEPDNLPGYRISIHGGEPVSNNEHLFGDTIQTAMRLNFISRSGQISLSSLINDLNGNLSLSTDEKNIRVISPQDEKLLNALFDALDKKWQDPDFNVQECCQEMAMSKSQLYRKVSSLSGLSPNELFREYKLEKALELMRKKEFNISQVTYAAGFSSPSYFTKCFKEKYGLLPLAYMELMK